MDQESKPNLRTNSCYDFTEISDALRNSENIIAAAGETVAGKEAWSGADFGTQHGVEISFYDMAELSKALGIVQEKVENRLKAKRRKLKNARRRRRTQQRLRFFEQMLVDPYISLDWPEFYQNQPLIRPIASPGPDGEIRPMRTAQLHVNTMYTKPNLQNEESV